MLQRSASDRVSTPVHARRPTNASAARGGQANNVRKVRLSTTCWQRATSGYHSRSYTCREQAFGVRLCGLLMSHDSVCYVSTRSIPRGQEGMHPILLYNDTLFRVCLFYWGYLFLKSTWTLTKTDILQAWFVPKWACTTLQVVCENRCSTCCLCQTYERHAYWWFQTTSTNYITITFQRKNSKT